MTTAFYSNPWPLSFNTCVLSSTFKEYVSLSVSFFFFFSWSKHSRHGAFRTPSGSVHLFLILKDCSEIGSPRKTIKKALSSFKCIPWIIYWRNERVGHFWVCLWLKRAPQCSSRGSQRNFLLNCTDSSVARSPRGLAMPVMSFTLKASFWGPGQVGILKNWILWLLCPGSFHPSYCWVLLKSVSHTWRSRSPDPLQ